MGNEITTIESQRKVVLRHLQGKGFITPNEAEALYGCKRLASRINELRKYFLRKEHLLKIALYAQIGELTFKQNQE